MMTVRLQGTKRRRSSALGWLRRRRAFAWVGLLALLLQVFVPSTHDAYDIAEAFAKASRLSHASAETLRLAMVLLERHQHGAPMSAGVHEHSVGQHESPAGSHHHSGDESGSLPCPVWQAAQAAANFVAPVLPTLYLPVPPPIEPQADQVGAVRHGYGFSHPQSRAPPREV